MKKILVPTDFSPASLSALKVAVKIAKRRVGIKIRLSHPYFVPRLASLANEDYGYDVRKQKQIIVDRHDKLHEIARMDFMKGIRIETQLLPHAKLKDILEHKENKDVDMIIVGMDNQDWEGRKEDGNADTVIRSAHCPVMIVHENIDENWRFDDIVFASNFGPELDNGFAPLKKIFEVLGGRLHLVKIVTPSSFESTLDAEKTIKEFAKRNYLTRYDFKVFNDKNLELGIHHFAKSIKANLIAMETHGHSGWLHFLKGSVLELVAHNSDIPVLSIKMKKESFLKP